MSAASSAPAGGTTVSVQPGAEPFSADGGPVGVLVLHGFTGSPRTVRPWAEYLAAAGLTVRAPRLPGHGTTWQDLATTGSRDWYATAEQAFTELSGRCEQVFLTGISMGACLAFRLAETQGASEGGYKRVPLKAAGTLPELWKLTVRDLAGVTQPVRVYRSTVDHVVGPPSMQVLTTALPAAEVVPLPDSYHVATLDNDAPAIFEGTLAFIKEHTAAEKRV